MVSQVYINTVTLTDATEFNRYDDAAYAALTSVAGTNTITATGPANLTSTAGRLVRFIPAATNTGASTINITPSGGAALGAKNIFSNGAACAGGELVINVPTQIMYDGTQYNILGGRGNGITLGTPVASTSGTAVDFTGIPANVKRITISFKGVSTNGTARVVIQIGDSGGIETSGYLSIGADVITPTALAETAHFGFGFANGSAATVRHGTATLTLENSTNNTWTCVGSLGHSDTAQIVMVAGSKSTSGVLDRVRITTGSGTDTFDAGEINIAYE